MKIDLNRGVTYRTHAPSGVQVFMYKDTPGVYLNAFGDPVNDKLAAACGFNTKVLGKERERRERLTEAQRAIEQEFSVDNVNEEVHRRDGYKIYHMGMGRYKLNDPDDNALNPTPLTEEQVYALLDHMVPPKDEPAPEPDKEPAKDEKKPDAKPDPEPEKPAGEPAKAEDNKAKNKAPAWKIGKPA